MTDMSRLIDINFDVRSDSGGRDPDIYSQTLKKYHQLLWSKPLPNGNQFNLQDGVSGSYLVYESGGSRFLMASDSILHSYRDVKRMSPIIESIDSEAVESFRTLGSTIGGYIIFPGNRINGKMTINSARGFYQKIVDRFDLTLECIRLHYDGQKNPLEEVLNRYGDYFSLFETFQGYVEFFHLQDLIQNESSKIRFFTEDTKPFDSSPLPFSSGEYLEYRENSMEFARRRNLRIQGWASATN
jgi:hypothetical protein